MLTIPAAGSEASNSAVVTNEDGWLKVGYGSLVLRPKFALLNPELTFSLPAHQIACGVADMMAHIMERYFTREKDVGFGDHLCEASSAQHHSGSSIAIAEPENYGARANIMWASTVAHNDILGSEEVRIGRPTILSMN